MHRRAKRLQRSLKPECRVAETSQACGPGNGTGDANGMRIAASDKAVGFFRANAQPRRP